MFSALKEAQKNLLRKLKINVKLHKLFNIFPQREFLTLTTGARRAILNRKLINNKLSNKLTKSSSISEYIDVFICMHKMRELLVTNKNF